MVTAYLFIFTFEIITGHISQEEEKNTREKIKEKEKYGLKKNLL